MSHACHAPGCGRQVPPRMLACRKHWFALPAKIRDAIWREYRSGQEIDKKPSLRYLAVRQLACAYLVFKPGDEEAVKETLPYLAQAVRYSKAAVAGGFGDPLVGLTAGWQNLEEGK